MGIETKYDYIYYTVLHQNWFDEAQRILTTELTTERLINVIERKLKRSKDWTLNNLKVDYSQHSEDIDYWIRINVRNKERPVFVQIENNQPIVTSGSGTLFVFYEDDGVHYSSASDDDVNVISPDNYYSRVDGLAGAGGRL
jgi:hypothetical protein